jgi:hypothetical protein
MQGLDVAVPLGSRVDADKIRAALAKIGPSDTLAEREVADERRPEMRPPDEHPSDEAPSPPPA